MRLLRVSLTNTLPLTSTAPLHRSWDWKPLMGRIGNVDVALGVDRYVRGRPELTWRWTPRTPLRQWLARGRQDLDAVVAPVGNIDLALIVDGNPARQPELPRRVTS